jgi:hypothetical protein
MNVVQFPHSNIFSALFGVSSVMEERFTREEIEAAAKIALFSAISSDAEGYNDDLAPGEEVHLEWLAEWMPHFYPHKMIRVHATMNRATTGG